MIRRVASMPLMPGQVDVHEHEAGVERLELLDRLLAGDGLADDLEPGRRRHHHLGGAPERDLVVDDQHGHGGHPGIVACASLIGTVRTRHPEGW